MSRRADSGGDTPRRWVAANRVILVNTGSLVATQVVNSALGFVYWWLAVRQFPPAAVGLAAAAVSTMLLLGTFGMLGLGTLLIGELPRRRGEAGALIVTALAASGAAGGGLGLLFALAAPRISPDLAPLAGDAANVAVFALGVGLTASALVLDSALIGLLRGTLQLWRNTVFAGAKLGALVVAGALTADRLGLTIYATWVIGNVISLLAAGVALAAGLARGERRPRWGLIRGLGRTALGHHALNLALQAPGLALPVVVTVTLSAALNAVFYIRWMLIGFVLVGVLALTTVLYATVAAEPAALARQLRLTLKLTLLGGLLGNTVLMAAGGRVLGLFGDAYAEGAGRSLHILALGVFPVIIKDHYATIRRIQGRVGEAALRLGAGSLFEVAAAAAGAAIAGLPGLSLAWVGAVCVEAVCLARTVRRAATMPPPEREAGA